MIALYNPLCNADKDKGSSDKIKGKLPSELQSLMGKLASQPAGRYAAEHMKIVKKYYAVSKGPDGKREFTPLTPQETKNTQVTKAANKKATNTQQSKPIVSPVSQQPNPAMANWKAINANPQVQAALGNLYGRGKIEASQFLQQQARQISDTSAVAANIPKILQKLNQFAELAENKKD